MLLRVEIPFTTENNIQPVVHWGSILHGALMEMLPDILAAKLHISGVKPFSQHLRLDAEAKHYWVLSALNEEMATVFETVLLNKLPCSVYLKQKGFSIQLGQPKVVEKSTYKELADRAFGTGTLERRHTFVFGTPTTFKTAGSHVLFPTTDLMVQSLMQRWDAFSDQLTLSDGEVREHLGEHISIQEYRLKTAYYGLEGTRVKGFVGDLNLYVQGPEALCRIADLLLRFACYSGIGIKTALGMGGCFCG